MTKYFEQIPWCIKRLSYGSAGFATVFVLSCSPDPQDYGKPNILFLLADDMGYGEPGCYGQEIIRTPVIDNLAENGMRFTDFYAGNTVCAPSRAVLMTGKQPGNATVRGNNGVYSDYLWDRVPLKKDELTLGEMLKGAGYQTAFIGKWHLDDPNDESTWAMNRGFDYAVQEQWGSRFGGRPFEGLYHWVNSAWDSVLYEQDKYDCIDVFRTDFAMDFLDQKEDDKPFFLFMSYRIPHGHERYIRNKELYSEKGWPESQRRHAAKITLLDGQIGRLLQRLEDEGEMDNTLVIFTSDNGAHSEGNDPLFFASTGGLKGHKRDLYEGGIRVPFIASWRNRILPGTVSNHIGAFQDFFPTLSQVAGIEIPAQTDGISIMPAFLGEDQPRHEYLYWEFQLDGWNRVLPDGGFRQAIRMGNWKAVRYGIDSDTELYDLDKDLFETDNIANNHPELIKRINSLFESSSTETDGFPYGGIVQDYRARDRYEEYILQKQTE